ncbi:GNAT family N-acetyltransferase [Blastomonas sp. AAP53]|uniref:GNAT family N-acetyltransferase n=1 Tax=Blastomonas sp. AAP53 TaxID=1248760 RepID=UPI00031F665F|nr:GNAT family N-acetyltransferase [Blastomonas sp. AAP53]
MVSQPPDSGHRPFFQLISGLAAEDAIGPVMQVMEQAFDPRFGEAWNHSQTRSMLAMPLTRVLLAEARGPLHSAGQGDAIGFAMTRRVADEEELLLIAVAPKWRQFGVASALLAEVIDDAQEAGVQRLHLEMRSNNSAIHLYQKFGFAQVGLRRDYYKGVDSQHYDALTLAIDI